MFGSVRFLVYTLTIQFVFPLFVFPFASCVVSFFFDVGMMGVTLRCLTSQDNLIKKIIWALRKHLFGVQWLLLVLASLGGLHCVHGLHVSSFCHICTLSETVSYHVRFSIG